MPVANSRICWRLRLGLKPKSKLSRVLVLLTVERRRRSSNCFWARRSTSSSSNRAKKVDVRGFVFDSLLIAAFQRVQDTRQPQLFERSGQLMGQFHAGPPFRWPTNSWSVRTKQVAGGAAPGRDRAGFPGRG